MLHIEKIFNNKMTQLSIENGEILRQGSISSTYAFGFLEEKYLLANVVWQAVNRFDKWCTNLAKFSSIIWKNSAVSDLVKLNGEF